MIDEATQRSGELFDAGYHCAEAVLLAMAEALDIQFEHLSRGLWLSGVWTNEISDSNNVVHVITFSCLLTRQRACNLWDLARSFVQGLAKLRQAARPPGTERYNLPTFNNPFLAGYPAAIELPPHSILKAHEHGLARLSLA